VRVRHGLAHLLEDAQEARQVVRRRRSLGQQRRQGTALHQLHGEIRSAVVQMANGMHWHDAGMLQLAGDLRFFQETLHCIGLAVEFRPKQFDCQGAIQFRVVHSVDNSSAAVAEPLENLVSAEPIAGRQIGRRGGDAGRRRRRRQAWGQPGEMVAIAEELPQPVLQFGPCPPHPRPIRRFAALLGLEQLGQRRLETVMWRSRRQEFVGHGLLLGRHKLPQLFHAAGVQAGHRADRAVQVFGDLRQLPAVVFLQDERLALPRVEFRQRLQQAQPFLFTHQPFERRRVLRGQPALQPA
jgi:hypothetical protein